MMETLVRLQRFDIQQIFTHGLMPTDEADPKWLLPCELLLGRSPVDLFQKEPESVKRILSSLKG
jgi:hypothetical protein